LRAFRRCRVETFDWIRNLFRAKLIGGALVTTEEEQFIDVSSDTSLEIKFLRMISFLLD